MIDFIVVAITIMLCWFLSESAGHFCQPAEFEYVANTHFENLKHLKNPANLWLTETSMYPMTLTRVMVIL